jgi:6-methylsalicylate decarboxylase
MAENLLTPNGCDVSAAEYGITRRSWLRGMGAAGLLAFGGDPVWASPRVPGIIDVHNHYVSPELLQFQKDHKVSPTSAWNVERELHDMDLAGVTVAMLSSFTPYDVGTMAERRALSREQNEFGAELVRQRPKRFGLLATIPLPDVDGCLAEIAHAYDHLHADGIMVYTSAGDRWLGHADFDPIHRELNRQGSVVLVHPSAPICCRGLVPGVPDPIIEFQTDTSRAIASLIFGGVTERYPNIRFVFSHGGGTMPFLIERFLSGSQAEFVPGLLTEGAKLPLKVPSGGTLKELRRMYYDTATVSNPVAMQALKAVVTPSQIVFGTDFWYVSAEYTAKSLIGGKVFSEAEWQQVAYLNAQGLFPRLKSL